MPPQNETPAIPAPLEAFRQSFKSAPHEFIFACGGSIPIATQTTPGSGNASPAPNALTNLMAKFKAVFKKKDKKAKQGESTGGTTEAAKVDTPGDAPSGNASTRSSSGSDPGSDSTDSSWVYQTLSSPPVTLRWDPENPSAIASQCKLTFPLYDGGQNILERLLRDMQPATFGLGGEDVHDESYRKASKLDTSRFASTFNPYELGIIDAVGQMLLPNLQRGSAKISDLKRGVRAELYKLNVYSGPSGLFRAHVDIPRSVDQFGSLVVCLPVAHTGGELKVQYLGRDVVFDWGASRRIQWAAFYSDCLHEVLEVKSGHRVTLTYNLYATHGGGAITGLSKLVDMTSLPIYKSLSGLLKLKEVLPKGGYIGFYTTHGYPHSSEHACLPHTLKGVDMAIWEILDSLGCFMELHPIVRNPQDGTQDTSSDDLSIEEDEENDDEIIGGELKMVKFDLYEEDYYSTENMLKKDWAERNSRNRIIRPSHVYWLNKSPNQYLEHQITYTAYGNEASAEVIYSACVILARVPSYEERKANDTE